MLQSQTVSEVPKPTAEISLKVETADESISKSRTRMNKLKSSVSQSNSDMSVEEKGLRTSVKLSKISNPQKKEVKLEVISRSK